MKRALALLAVALVVPAAGACSKQEARKTASDAYNQAEKSAKEAANRAEDVINDRNVEIKDIAYHPPSRTVKVGTEVTWLNHDQVKHTVTADNNSFRGELEAGKEFSFRFTQSGTFTYFCEIHGKDTMAGTIVVE